MAPCDYCRTTIVMGGVRKEGMRFCNKKCAAAAARIFEIPQTLVDEEVESIRPGPCPRCGGEGPVELYTSHKVWSVLVLTRSWSEPQVCCQRCAIKVMGWAAMFSAVAGWWGFPVGVLVTPLYIGRNIGGILASGIGDEPSQGLRNRVRKNLARRLAVETAKKTPMANIGGPSVQPQPERAASEPD